MAWALKFPADSGNSSTNRTLVQISGISGTLSTVRYTLHENLPPRPSDRARYLFDIRRLVNSTTQGSGTGWLLTTAVGGIDGSGTSDHLINGIPTTAAGLFGTIAAESICSFNVNSVPSGGCIAFGARFNEVESFTSIAIRNIVIIDGAGTHTIDMSSSGGTSNEFTSTDGVVTLKLFNFTGGQWVFYNSVTANIPNNTLGAALNQPCAINLNNYFPGATSYSVLSGSLPTGLSIVGNQIVGTPTSAETTTLVIRASNSIDTLDSATITFNTGLWYLLCAGGTGTTAPIVAIPDWIPSNQSDWACRIKIRTGSDITTDRMICGRDDNNTNANQGFKAALNNGTIVFLYKTYWNTTNWLQYSVTANTEYDFLYKVTPTAFELWNNATNTLLVSKTLPNRATAGTIMGRSVVGQNATLNSTLNQSPAGVRYYNVEFIDYGNASNSRFYDTSSSGGVGSVWPSSTGANNGTQQGTWPSDNSEWVTDNPITLPVYPPSRFVFPTGQPVNVNLDDYFDGATSYSVVSGSLPAGLSIVGNLITGTPTVAGDSSFVLRGHSGAATLDTGLLTATVGLWYLQFPNSVDSRVTIPAISAPTTQFRLELDFSYASTAASAAYIHSNTGSSYDNGTLRIEKSASNELVVITSLNGKGRVITTVTGAAINTRMLITIEWDSISQNIVIKRDTTTIATLAGYTAFDIATITAICTNLTAAPFDLYGLKVTSNGTLIRNYDPNLSFGSGVVLTDSVSAQHGTQAGTWPANDSEWVSYAPAGGENKTGEKPNAVIQALLQLAQQTKDILVSKPTSLANISTGYLYQIIYDIGGAFSSLITVSTSKASTKSVNSVKAGMVANVDVSGIGAAKTANSTKQNVSASSDFVIGSGSKTPSASKPGTQVNVDALAAAVKDVGTIKVNSSVLAHIMSLASKQTSVNKPATSASADFASFLYEISYGITGSFTSVVLANLVLQATKEALSQKPASSGGFSGIKVATKESSSQKPASSANISTSKVSTKAINSGMYSEVSTATQYGWEKEAYSSMYTQVEISWKVFGTSKNIDAQVILFESDYSSIFGFNTNSVTTITYWP